MKKYFLLIVCLCVFCATTACAKNNKNIDAKALDAGQEFNIELDESPLDAVTYAIKQAGMSLDKPVTFGAVPALMKYAPRNLFELESYSEIIVRAKVLPNSIINKLTITGNMFTDIEILNVYRGNVKQGEILTIIEDYFLMESEDAIHLTTFENYGPSLVDQEYIFFLVFSTTDESSMYYGKYSIIGAERGRYPVFNELDPNAQSVNNASSGNTIDDFTNRELFLGDLDSTLYRQLFQGVINKYFVIN